MIETAVAIASAVATVVGTGVSIYGSIQQAKAEKRARKAEQARIRAQQRRERRQQLRQARIARAQSLNAGVQLGGEGGSGLAGGLSSLSSQTGTNLGYSGGLGKNAIRISNLQQDAASANQLSGFGQALSGFGSTAYSNRANIASGIRDVIG